MKNSFQNASMLFKKEAVVVHTVVNTALCVLCVSVVVLVKLETAIEPEEGGRVKWRKFLSEAGALRNVTKHERQVQSRSRGTPP